MRKILAILFAVIFLAGCTAPAADPAVQQTNVAGTTAALVQTELANATMTQAVAAGYTPTPAPATATPEAPAQPAVEPDLSPANNAGLVLENNTWVAKDPEGEITATWDGSAWTYHMDAITVERTIIGFEGFDAAILDPVLAGAPADTPEKHLTDPATGQPLPYGYVREDRIQAVSTEEQPYEIPISMYAVRMLGTVQATTTDNAVVLEMPLSADRSLIFTMAENAMQGVLLYSLSPELLAGEASLVEQPAVLFNTANNPNLFNVDLLGQQMLMAVYHDVPDILWQVYPQWNINETSAALRAYLEDQSNPVPAINMFDSFAVIPTIWNAALWVPASVVEALQSTQMP